jgi:hypothetical protein
MDEAETPAQCPNAIQNHPCKPLEKMGSQMSIQPSAFSDERTIELKRCQPYGFRS